MTEELKEQIHERIYNLKVPTLGFSRQDLFNIAMEYVEPREIQLTKARKLLKTLIEDYISEPEVLPDGSCEDNELRNLIKEVEQFLKENKE